MTPKMFSYDILFALRNKRHETMEYNVKSVSMMQGFVYKVQPVIP